MAGVWLARHGEVRFGVARPGEAWQRQITRRGKGMSEQGPIAADAAYDVAVTCPACGLTDEVEVVLRSRLERLRGEAKLGLRVKAGKRDHKCGQTRLTVVAETGEIQELGL